MKHVTNLIALIDRLAEIVAVTAALSIMASVVYGVFLIYVR